MPKKLFRKTKRLIIRPLETKDYQAWRSAHSSVLKMQNAWDLPSRQPDKLTKEVFMKDLANLKKQRDDDSFISFGIFAKETGEYVGMISIMDISRGIFQNAYIGYRIFNNHWRQGFGKEACLAAIDIAFRDLRLHRIEAAIAPRNIRSLRLARSLGLRKEGKSLRRLLLNSKWQDVMIYAMTCEEVGMKYKMRTISTRT